MYVYYKVLYFLTAMSPAYLLFFIQLYYKFGDTFDDVIFGIRFNIFVWLGILILFFVILLILLKGVLIYQYTNSSTDQVLGEGKEKFKENKLKEKNGDVISFLLGNILPAVFIIEEDLFITILTFLIIQVLIYFLVIMSTDIFPNVFLIILGIDLCKTEDENYVFTFKSNKFKDFKVYHLGEPFKSKVFITMYEK